MPLSFLDTVKRYAPPAPTETEAPASGPVAVAITPGPPLPSLHQARNLPAIAYEPDPFYESLRAAQRPDALEAFL